MSKDAMDMERLQARLAQRDRQLAAIHRITAALRTLTKVSDVVQEALRVSLEVVEAQDGSVLLYNPDKNKLVFAYVLGEKAAELTGMELDPHQGIAGAVFQSGQVRVSEDVSQEADHDTSIEQKTQYRTRNMVTVPLKSPQGQVLGVMQVLNKKTGAFTQDDVEVLEILGGQIAIAIESARLYEEARVAEVVRFIGNISHDVKNMITPAQTGAETLQMLADDCYAQLEELFAAEHCPDGLSEKIWAVLNDFRALYPEILSMILDSCDAVQQRMLEISAAIKGLVTEPHFAKHQLSTIIERVLKVLKLVAEKAGVSLNYEPEGDLPEMDLDERQMYNAIYNLVNNALQATPAGGRVSVKTRLAEPGEFPAFSDQRVVVLEVADTGEGMPPEIKAKVFTDQAVSTKPMGTGLGTKIVKNVMDVHEAKIEVESELGKGTTIRCLIPVERRVTE